MPAAWWWGTNRVGGSYYAGRVHVVHPNRPFHGLCGLPITDLWELRPPMPEHLCPDCCVLAMAAAYPPFATAVPRQATGQHAADTIRFTARSDQPTAPADLLTEQMTVMPASELGDDP